MIRTSIFLFLIILWKDSISQIELDYSLRSKISTENLSWNIAGNSGGESPTILSELLWEDNMRIGGDMSLEIKLKKRLIAAISYSYSNTISGRVTDLDYSEDNRKGITSNETYKSNIGNDQIYRLSLGYSFYKNQNELSLFTVLQLRDSRFSLIDKLKDLYSRYDNRLLGAGVGASLTIPFADHIELNAKSQISFNQYDAKANWNLRSDFAHPKSFVHDVTVFDFDSELKFSYQIANHFKLGFFAGFSQYSNIGNGVDKLYYNDGNISFTRLNEVKSKSLYGGLSILYSMSK